MESISHVACVSTIETAIAKVLGIKIDDISIISEDSTFVKLGGDSLAALHIAAECQKAGISISAGTFLRAPTLKEAIAQAKDSALLVHGYSEAPLITLWQSPGRSNTRHVPEALATASSSISEVSGGGQQSIFVPSSHDAVINIPGSEVPGAFSIRDGQKFISAKGVLDRIDAHEWTEPQLLLLRETVSDQDMNILTMFKSYNNERDAQLVCDIWNNSILSEPIFRDLIVELDIPSHQLMHRRIIQVDTEQEFKSALHDTFLASGPLSYLTVVQLASSCIAVIWRVHHFFMDGFSARILEEKIRCNLSAREVVAAPGPSFKMIVQELSILRRQRREATTQFWDSKRAHFSRAIGEFRLNPQRVHEESASQKTITIQIPEVNLKAAQARTGYTTIVYFAAAWALTLGRFMDSDQVYFGLALSGRDLPMSGVFDVIGPLINMLPLFVQLPQSGDKDLSVAAFLRYVQKGILELNDVQHSDVTVGLNRQFNSIMTTQFEHHDETDQLPPIDRNIFDMRSGIPLNFLIRKESKIEILYSTAQFSEGDTENIRSIFELALSHLLQGDDGVARVALEPMLGKWLTPPAMEQRIRKWSNCGSLETLDASKGDDLVTLFESVVARQPNEAAVTRGWGQGISYDELDQAAGDIARHLSWIAPKEPVCVYAIRSVNWVVAIFGILKAGGIYTPLDPSAPATIRNANFARSCARAMLYPSRANISKDTTPVNCIAIAVNEIVEEDKTGPQHGRLITPYPRRRIARPDDPAYICFTSGSTGQPKAVKCTQKGLVAFQKDYVVRLAAGKGTVVAQVMSPVFDGSIHEVFSALTYGATLRLASAETQDHPFAHLQECDSAILTPSIASVLNPDQYPRLHNVYLVGEAVPQRVSDAWAKSRNVYNMYGPTEATCGATIKKLVPKKPITLGQANHSSRVYLLDRNKYPLPPGAVGELYLAGIQVSDGYVSLPVENEKRFFPDSIYPESDQRMYRTGDYAYRDSSTGEIHLIGRRDRQIKLNGFRIDLDDLEARITRTIPNCKGAAVLLRDEHLIAMYQSSSSSGIAMDESSLKKLVRTALPPYAVPRRILRLLELPLTAVGKLDYKKLESTEIANIGRPQARQKAMTDTESMIIHVVRSLMKLDSSILIDQDSNLAALGGHSIVQLRLASQISSLIQRNFTVRKVIENPVISDLASSVDEAVKGEAEANHFQSQHPCLSHGRTAATFVNSVSPIESVWFSKYEQDLGTSSFNVSHVSELDDHFDQHSALLSAWTTVLARHMILRSRFRSSMTARGGVERVYADQPPRALYVESLDVQNVINTEFLLETDHPIRVLVSKRHMIVCVSHIICDYSTLDRLFKEFRATFHSDEKLEASLTSQRPYQDTLWWDINVDPVTANFWQSYLSGINFHSLPPYLKRARSSYHGTSRTFKLSKNAVFNLKLTSKSLHLTRHQIMLGIVSLILQADSPSKNDLVLGSPYLGRQEEEMSCIGLFLQPLPIRVPRHSRTGVNLCDSCVTDFLLAVQDSAQSALGHGIGWVSLLNLLSSSADANLGAAASTSTPNHPLFDAMVTFHERSAVGIASPLPNGAIPGVEPLLTWTEGAKFAIMFEFSELSASSITLRIEHDTSIFSLDEVMTMAKRIDATLTFLQHHISSSTRLKDLEDMIFQADSLVASTETFQELELGARLTTLA